jgi:hypothetical protein
MRTGVLRRIGGYPNHLRGDNSIGIMLAAYGGWVATGHASYRMRIHPGQSSRYTRDAKRAWVRRSDPAGAARFVLPHWRQQWELYATVERSALSLREKIAVSGTLLRSWSPGFAKEMADEALVAAQELLRVGHAERRAT